MAKETKIEETVEKTEDVKSTYEVDTEVLKVRNDADGNGLVCELNRGDIVEKIDEKSTKTMMCIRTAGIEGYVEPKFVKSIKK